MNLLAIIFSDFLRFPGNWKILAVLGIFLIFIGVGFGVLSGMNFSKRSDNYVLRFIGICVILLGTIIFSISVVSGIWKLTRDMNHG